MATAQPNVHFVGATLLSVFLLWAPVSSDDKKGTKGERCPDFAETEYTDTDGDCICPPGLECVEGDNYDAGCPFSGGDSGKMYFSPACADCKCRSLDLRMCPESALTKQPDQYGNCKCGDGTAYCYATNGADTEGNYFAGCDRFKRPEDQPRQQGKRYNDTKYFRHDSKESHCMPPRYAVDDTDAMVHCNADRPKCLASASLDAAFVCEKSEFLKCCDEDAEGCFTKCCRVLPGWVVLVIMLSALTVIMTPVGACYYWQKHKQRGIAPEPELNDEVGVESAVVQSQGTDVASPAAPQTLLAPARVGGGGKMLPPVRGSSQWLGANGATMPRDDDDLADVDEEMFPGDTPGQNQPRKERRGSAKSNLSRRGSATSRRGSATSRRGSASSQGSRRWSGVLSPGGGITNVDWDFFKSADTDGDGQLDLEEALAQGMTEEMFKRIDIDGNGLVTQEEFRDYMDSQTPIAYSAARG